MSILENSLASKPFNKSVITNVISAGIIGLSYCFADPHYQVMLSNVGYFALSGALTNWIAIFMLFEKVPFLYGSGVIPLRFKEFKQGIRNLVMNEFFTQENIAMVSKAQLGANLTQEMLDEIDYDKIYDALVEGILESRFGKMILMMGGKETLEVMREPVQARLKVAVTQIVQDQDLQNKLSQRIGTKQQAFLLSIEEIVDNRLSKLTPEMVKQIIQKNDPRASRMASCLGRSLRWSYWVGSEFAVSEVTK